MTTKRERIRLFTHRPLTWVKQHPKEYLQLIYTKLKEYFRKVKHVNIYPHDLPFFKDLLIQTFFTRIPGLKNSKLVQKSFERLMTDERLTKRIANDRIHKLVEGLSHIFNLARQKIDVKAAFQRIAFDFKRYQTLVGIYTNSGMDEIVGFLKIDDKKKVILKDFFTPSQKLLKKFVLRSRKEIGPFILSESDLDDLN